MKNTWDSEQLWTELKVNAVRKEACTKHYFSCDEVGLGQPVVCDNCGGSMQLTDASMYLKGYMAAGGHPDDVWPAWGTRYEF